MGVARVVSLLLLLSSSAARAEEPAAAAPVTESAAVELRELARVRYRRGVDAFEEERYRDAIDLFLDADQLAPSAALSFNIATAYSRTGQVGAALRWYRDFLRRAPGARDRAQVEDTVARLEAELAARGVQLLCVTSSPARATVSVDGNEAGRTPWAGELKPGAHQLELTLAGHVSQRLAVDLPAAHATDVAVELVAETPRSEPPTAAKAVTAVTAEPSARSSRPALRTAGWVGLAAGGAALGGAVVFELLRSSAESQARDDSTQIGRADALDTMHGRQTAARVLLGVGGALAATSGVLLWLGREPKHSGETGVALLCGPAGCTSAVRGSF